MFERLKKIHGIAYCFIWFGSIIVGFYFLYVPLLPLLIINRKWYRRSTDVVFVMWEAFNMGLTELMMGSKVVVVGDTIRSDENSLIIVNHRTRVDWNYLFVGLHKSTFPANNNAKLILKDEVKSIPGIGWTMQMTRCLYIHRSWQKDESLMNRMINYLSDDEGTPFQLILFPEGTNLTKETKAKSDTFAQASNRKPFDYVLYPRTTGFSYIANKMRERKKLDAIYDLTLVYPDVIPETEKYFLEGNIPKTVNLLIKRHPCKSVPSTLIGLEKWLLELWKEKEERLASYYTGKSSAPATAAPSVNHLHVSSLIAWSFIFYLIFSWILLRPLSSVFFVLTATIGMHLISKYTPGLQEIEIKLHMKEFWSHLFFFIKDRLLHKSQEKAE